MNKFLMPLIFSIMVSSCAGTNTSHLKKELIRGEEKFNYSDKNGQYLVRLSSGFNKKENTFYTKRSLEIPNKETENALEQVVALANIGKINESKTILRPKLSQYNIWFEGKKFFTELKLNSSSKTIDIKMISPEKQWNGKKQIKLPNTKALYCFFSQVMECAKAIGFLSEAIKQDVGTMNFYIIWEGYPYLSETFSDFPNELLSQAQLEYDGKTKNSEERRFNLKVGGQSIFYIVDKNEQMKKMFWVSQGISMVSTLAKNEDNDKDSDLKEIGGSLE